MFEKCLYNMTIWLDPRYPGIIFMVHPSKSRYKHISFSWHQLFSNFKNQFFGLFEPKIFEIFFETSSIIEMSIPKLFFLINRTKTLEDRANQSYQFLFSLTVVIDVFIKLLSNELVSIW